MKKAIKYLLPATLLLLILVSCKKAGSAEITILAPTNLVFTALVATDGSGLVNFTAQAMNAVSFDFEFGNGEIKTAPTGVIDYVYSRSGTNTFTVTVTAKSGAGLTLKKTIPVTVTVTPSVPTLFWSEEFNIDGPPDSTKWGYDLGAGGWGNNELEYYTNRRENSIVQGGVLKINAIRENFNNSPYTSARLLSKGKFAFTYGKVEVKAKLPAGVGTWPAIWMLGSNAETAGWPACGEIDIMEHVGKWLNRIYGTLHYPGRSGGNADGSTRVVDGVTTAFHIYTLDWTADSIKIYVDGLLNHSVNNSRNIPFNHDFFLILNVAMGGGFGGDVDPSFTRATMEIDYIRVYK
ncbi:MAG: family 16 glycosylhydrolase [Ferruginibacter sp.]